MKNKVSLLGVALLVIAPLGWAGEKSTWIGVVSDDHCGIHHSVAGDEAAACVRKCVQGGAKYVLVHKGKVYKLDAQDKFAPFAGRQVKVTGTLDGDAIKVASIEAAGER